MAKLSLQGQITEVEREIKLRENVYPRLVQTGKMKSGEADYHTSAMCSVLATLKWLELHEAKIKQLAPELADKSQPQQQEAT